MSQTFDVTKPISGTTKLSQLYQIIRDHDQANQSSFSGTIAPTNPVQGQLWEDTGNDKLFLYTSGGWYEIAVANIGLGLELIAARGAHASLDQRLDAQINEDGTLKASTSLNPSQWYDMTVASGYISTTSFRAYGDNYVSVYYPNRRLKVNTPSAVYTSVASSSYTPGSPGYTDVVTREAVVTTGLVSVSHSIVAPLAGGGGVSFEMVGSMNLVTQASSASLNIGDSVILLNGAYTTTLKPAAEFGTGRPLFLANIHTTADHIVAAYSGQTINGAATVTVKAGQSMIIISAGGTAWYRFDQPNSLGEWTDYSSTVSISGWSSTSIKKAFYRLVGKVCYVSFHIYGPTNGSGIAYITGPKTSRNEANISWSSPVCIYDNGALAHAGMAAISANDTTINLYKDWGMTVSFGASGNLRVQGNIWYDIP